MSGNTDPIFPATPKLGWGVLTTANTAKDGTGTVANIFEAGANGARLDRVKARPLGTNVATVLRIFLNNGGDNDTAANNSLFHEETIAETTLSEVAALDDYDIQFDPPLVLPAGYRINAAIGTEVAAGLQVTAQGGDY